MILYRVSTCHCRFAHLLMHTFKLTISHLKLTMEFPYSHSLSLSFSLPHFDPLHIAFFSSTSPRSSECAHFTVKVIHTHFSLWNIFRKWKDRINYFNSKVTRCQVTCKVTCYCVFDNDINAGLRLATSPFLDVVKYFKYLQYKLESCKGGHDRSV